MLIDWARKDNISEEDLFHEYETKLKIKMNYPLSYTIVVNQLVNFQKYSVLEWVSAE